MSVPILPRRPEDRRDLRRVTLVVAGLVFLLVPWWVGVIVILRAIYRAVLL